MHKNKLIFMLTAGLLCCSSAHAAEFGNIFGSPETEQASRAASATALEAISELMKGLQARELRSSDGSESFQAAAQAFGNAADKMDKILLDIPDNPLSDAQIASLKSRFIPGTEAYAFVQGSKSVRDLYQGFARKTRQLGSMVAGLAGRSNAFAAISPVLIEYFALADGIVAARAS
ncbi:MULTISPECIES: hypothetical protein [unclassified Mesorhizobium]|uniref:hypothetical protein n=1 Tax=unclassified Mesorhizobium TaxID=325217 RepID=UPI000FCBD19D|nr:MULTISPECIES: hypothetical protein [unclassified Mesorhizobium]RUV19933.1 hypothetical protein EOB80_17080 [Mesorhizobium sp. M7A.F.Ca.MR.245.00.0.0]RUV37436.1 hypothetical protein EOB49_11800 [Mesorhizobium sp. M7A.F.Ca.MR.148.00.0.0]RUV53813.1 hypothetical protein EOB77_00765 [Mesorhizobium sp. M7A.F.Ca.MR.228.00.0.0]